MVPAGLETRCLLTEVSVVCGSRNSCRPNEPHDRPHSTSDVQRPHSSCAQQKPPRRHPNNKLCPKAWTSRTGCTWDSNAVLMKYLRERRGDKQINQCHAMAQGQHPIGCVMLWLIQSQCQRHRTNAALYCETGCGCGCFVSNKTCTSDRPRFDMALNATPRFPCQCVVIGIERNPCMYKIHLSRGPLEWRTQSLCVNCRSDNSNFHKQRAHQQEGLK